MKTILFIFKSILHFIWVFITPFILHKYTLSFIKEENGCWYIDFKNWPFNHENLLMVAGADLLCEYFSNGDNKTTVDIITSSYKINKLDKSYIRLNKKWAYLKYGGQYYLDNIINNTNSVWICQVTLFVIGWWPKYIYVKKH